MMSTTACNRERAWAAKLCRDMSAASSAALTMKSHVPRVV